jgi:predicted dithiol-disulfide oxidoreductase (DUF899 family)
MNNIAGGLVRLAARDTSFAAVSRAPIAKIDAFKRRMKGTFPSAPPVANGFNTDFHVTRDPMEGSTEYNDRPTDFRGELPGLSVFVRDSEQTLRSYSTDFRGLDMPPPRRRLLDGAPLGRQETEENSMAAGEASWFRLHDSYGRGGAGACACRRGVGSTTI